MIDRTTLAQMGFKQVGPQNGWGHEVWYNDGNGGDCWVHFDSDIETELYDGRESGHLAVNGDTEGMERFFRLFVENIENSTYRSCYVART